MRYQFVGHQETVFPTIVTVGGALVIQPGEIVETDLDIDHPDLVPATGKAEADVAAHVGVVVAEPVIASPWHMVPDRDPLADVTPPTDSDSAAAAVNKGEH